MRFRNIGKRPHYLTDERLVQPGEVIETDMDLAASFPDKFQRLDGAGFSGKAQGTPDEVQGEAKASAPASDTPAVLEASQEPPQKSAKKPARSRSSRRTAQ